MAQNAPLYKVEPSSGEDGARGLTDVLPAGKSGLSSLLQTAGYLDQDQDPLRLSHLPHAQGKRRKFMGVKTEVAGGCESRPPVNLNNVHNQLEIQYPSTSSDGKIKLSIVTQPEQQHRARYQTEGSRGAIKDRGGASFPTVKLEGYTPQAKFQIYIGNDSGKVTPHMFYQACRVTGKNSYPCEEKKINGTDVIEVSLESGLEKTLVCDCVGILKERFADVEARFPKHKNWKTTKKKSTKCRLVFRVKVTNSRGDEETLQIASGVINCTQLPGLPEIMKMSTHSSSVKGGDELWIIGKNFLKETVVVFSYSVKEKCEPLWTETCKPDKDFLHQVHLIVKIPPFFNQDITTETEVSLHIECGDKQSDQHTFTYTPTRPTMSAINQAASVIPTELPKGVAAPAAVAINENYTKTRAVTLLPNNCDSRKNSDDFSGLHSANSDDLASAVLPSPSPESFLHNHKNKKRCLDYQSNKLTAHARRTRSVPRPKTISGPNLMNEDTVFVSGPDIMDNKFTVTSFTQAVPWKGTVTPAKMVSAAASTPAAKMVAAAAATTADASAATAIKRSSFDTSPPQKLSFGAQDMSSSQVQDSLEAKPEFTLFTKRSLSNDDDESHHAAPVIYHDENSSICEESDSLKSDFSSNLTTDFSNVFSLMREKATGGGTNVSVPGQPSSSFSNFSDFQTQQSQSQQKVAEHNLEFGYQPKLEYSPQPKVEFVQTPPSNTWAQEGIIKERSEEKDILPEPVNLGTISESSNLARSSVSVKATDEDKATISIKLPTSILKDQKHFQNVINTINSTLLRNPDDSISPASQDHEQPASLNYGKVDNMKALTEDGLNSSPRLNLSPSGKVTSVPVSVLTSKTRKRNFSKEASHGTGEQGAAQKWHTEAMVDPLTVTAKDSMEWEGIGAKKIQGDNAMDWSTDTSRNSASTSQNWSDFESSIKLQPLDGSETSKSSSVIDPPGAKTMDFNNGMNDNAKYSLSSSTKPFVFEQPAKEQNVFSSESQVLSESGPDQVFSSPASQQFSTESRSLGPQTFSPDLPSNTFNPQKDMVVYTTQSETPVYNTQPANVNVYTTENSSVVFAGQPVTAAFTCPAPSVLYTTQPSTSIYTTQTTSISDTSQTTSDIYTNEPNSVVYTSQPTQVVYTSEPVYTSQPSTSGTKFPQFVPVANTSSANMENNAGKELFQAVTTSTVATKDPSPVFSLLSAPLSSNTVPQSDKTQYNEQANQILQPVLQETNEFQVVSPTANSANFSVQSTLSNYIQSPSSVISTYVENSPCDTPSTYVQSSPIQNPTQSILSQTSPCVTVDSFVQSPLSVSSSVSSYVQNSPSSSLVQVPEPSVTTIFARQLDPASSESVSQGGQVSQLVSFDNSGVKSSLNSKPASLIVLPSDTGPVIEQADYNMATAAPLQSENKDETLNLQTAFTTSMGETGLSTETHYGQVTGPTLNSGIFGDNPTPGINNAQFANKSETAVLANSFNTPTLNDQGQAALTNIEPNKSIAAMDYEINDPVTSFEKVSANDMAMFDDPSAIQGDPLLSETSAVIEVQKDIENAGNVESYSTQQTEGSVVSMEGQEWKATETSSDPLQPWGQ